MAKDLKKNNAKKEDVIDGLQTEANEASSQKQVKKPNNPNKNEIEVSTKGNQIILDPEVPADQNVKVKLNIQTEKVKQELDIQFIPVQKSGPIRYDSYPEAQNGYIGAYQDQTVEIYVNTNQCPAGENNEKFKLEVASKDVAKAIADLIEIKPVTGSETAWLVTSKDEKVTPAIALKLTHKEYEDTLINVEFRDITTKPVIKYQIQNQNNEYNRAQVGVPFALRTWFNTEHVKCSSVDNDAVINMFDANTGSDLQNGVEVGVTYTTYSIMFRSEGRHEIELTNSLGESRYIEFEAFELGVGEYMKLNKKKMELKIGEEKYIHCEVALQDSDIQIESDGILAGVLRYKLEGNRIYIKATQAGSYKVLVKSKRYNDSEFTVIVSDEVYKLPEAPKPETYFDLGEMPTNILTQGMSVDNFVTKLTEDANKSATDAQKICFALNSKEFIPYSTLTNMICLANQAIISGIPEERAKGVKQLFTAFKSIVNQEDYIIFKQQMLLMKLIFNHYKEKGLAEATILYNAGGVENLEFLSHMVKFVHADIENKLKGFNINNMNNTVNMRAKERLLRYVFELPDPKPEQDQQGQAPTQP